MNSLIKIKALKYPNIDHYEWEGEIVEKHPAYLIVLCKPGRRLIHHSKNEVYTINNTSLEYFPFHDWYTVAIEVDDRKVVSVYCNVAKPSIFDSQRDELTFIDLDLDYIKEDVQDWKVVDEEEFEENSIKYNYPTKLKEEAQNALEKLKVQAMEGKFPFNTEILKYLK